MITCQMMMCCLWLVAQAPVSAPLPAATSRVAGAAPSVNLNTATVQELSTLPGIGPKRAEQIVEHRARHRFRRPQELLLIRGIGPKSYAKLKAWVRVE